MKPFYKHKWIKYTLLSFFILVLVDISCSSIEKEIGYWKHSEIEVSVRVIKIQGSNQQNALIGIKVGFSEEFFATISIYDLKRILGDYKKITVSP